MTIFDTAKSIYRRYDTDGVPPTGDHEPEKIEIVALFGKIQSEIELARLALAFNGVVFAQTRAALYALNPAVNTAGIVYADATASYNGLYIHPTAGTGAGNWPKADFTLPSTVLADIATLQTMVASQGGSIADLSSRSVVTLTVTSSGPANAIVATSPAGDGAASNIVFLGIPAADTNTIASDVAPTLQVDSDIARVIRDRNGDLLDPGDVRGSMLLKRVTGQWRMLTDPGRTRLSGAFADDAEAAANGVPLKESYRRTDGLVAWRQD